jgi:Fe2+ or Zn2+ uptake regulation protein
MAQPLDADLRDRIAARLGQGGQRLTRNRAALVGVLASAGRPVTIPEIGDADPALAVSSIYRNLTQLEELDVVRRVVSDGDYAHYELAEELTEDHHHHLICSSCGGVEDVAASTQLEAAVRAASRSITRSTGFHVERHLVDLIGMCADCA